MKRAGISISFETLIGLVLAAVLIPGLILVIVNVGGILTNKPDQSTLNSFDALVLTINQLTAAKETSPGEPGGKVSAIKSNEVGNLFIDEIPFSLQENFGLVGFDKDVIPQRCGPLGIDSETLAVAMKKPAQCLKLPCLCIAKLGTTDQSVNNYISCETLKNVKSIDATPESKNHNNYGITASEQNLVLWSDCGARGSFGVKNIKIIRTPTTDNKEGPFNLLFDISPITRK